MANMNHSLARGYARHLIKGTCSLAQCPGLEISRFITHIYHEFSELSRTRKPTTIPRKLRRASRGMLDIHMLKWTRQHKLVILDRMLGDVDTPIADPQGDGTPSWHEDRLYLYTLYCERLGPKLQGSAFFGPSICLHALTRMLQRGAATPDTLGITARSALERVREIIALRRPEAEPVEYLIPFAQGALAVHTLGQPAVDSPDSAQPLLSIRTYLSEDMISTYHLSRLWDLQDFYLRGDKSDTALYLKLLEANMRNQSKVSLDAETSLCEETRTL